MRSISTVAMGGLVVHTLIGAPHARGQSRTALIAGAPARCYERANETENLEHAKAMRLCLGARSVAPATCYASAEDTLDLSDVEAVRLCRSATSTAPVACARRLDDTTQLEDVAIVSSCAAIHHPLVPASGAAGVACLESALDQLPLTENQAVRLCRGSRTIAPVTCYRWGEDNILAITDHDLVTLCSVVVAARPAYPGGPFY